MVTLWPLSRREESGAASVDSGSGPLEVLAGPLTEIGVQGAQGVDALGVGGLLLCEVSARPLGDVLTNVLRPGGLVAVHEESLYF